VVADGNMFLINTGNLVQYGSAENFQTFQTLMAGFPLPFYPLPGNHDLDENDSLSNFLTYSGVSAVPYSFDSGPAHFTMINSAAEQLLEKDLAWIEQDLAATTQPVKIVCLHHPPLYDTLRSGAAEFMSLMQEYDVNTLFAGHLAIYSQEERDGTMYVTSGGAGAPLDPNSDQSFHHYLQVTIDNDQVDIQAVRIE